MRIRVPARCRLSARQMSRQGRAWQALTAALVVAALGGLAIPSFATALPPGYAYEKVTPAEKGNGEIGGTKIIAGLRSTADGNRIMYGADSAFLGAKNFNQIESYYAFRTDAGWVNSSVGARLPFYPNTSLAIFGGDPTDYKPESTSATNLSADGQWTVFGTNRDPVTGALVPNRIYRVNVETGALQRISPTPVAGAPNVAVYSFLQSQVVGNADFSTLYYPSTAQLTPESTLVPEFEPKIYRFSNGQLSLASWTPSGEPAPGIIVADVENEYGPNGLSEDTNVYWYTNSLQEFDKRLYRGEAGVHSSTLASESEKTTGPVSPGESLFMGASGDGERMVFTSPQELVDGAGELVKNVYLYTNGPDPENERNLTLISADNNAEDEGEGSPGISSVWSVSDDARTVYFSTTSQQLVPGAPTGPGEKLYRWHDGQLTYITTAAMTPRAQTYTNLTPNLSSPDGRYFMFVSNSEGITPDDNGGFQQLYLYDNQTGAIRCASCVFGGTNTSPVQLEPFYNFVPITEESRRWLSPDGRVFFTTAEQLVPSDTNEAADVYTWKEGALSMISGGRGVAPARFADASANGDTVFFITQEQLVKSDTDEKADLYAARLGGGLPEPEVAAPAAPCEGAACRGEAHGAPAGHQVGTGTLKGSGDLAGGEACGPALKRAKAAQHKAKRTAAKSRHLIRKAKRAHGAASQRLHKRGVAMHRAALKQRRHSHSLRGKLRACRKAAR